MTWRNKRDHINNYTCKWRRSKLGKTNPNHHYFARLLKKETNDFLSFTPITPNDLLYINELLPPKSTWITPRI